MKNLVRRGHIYYFRKQVNDLTTGKPKLFCESLHTDDKELAKARLKVKQQQFVAGELARLRSEKSAATLAQIFEKRELVGGISANSIYCSKQALLGMFKVVRKSPDLEPANVSSAEITEKLVRDYQDAMRAKYEAEVRRANPQATADDFANARDRADRTSKSLFKQAKNLFSKKHSLMARYKEMGLIIPESVKAFCEARGVGSMTTKVYLPPDDTVLTKTFTEIEAEKEANPIIWKVFWAAIGFAGRRNEVMDLRIDDFAEIDGQLWVVGGRGKDKLEIHLPIINWPVHTASGTVPADVIRQLIVEAKREGRAYLFAGTNHHRQDILPRLVNAWLSARGWKDEKKLHGLRAYIGSLLYSQDAHLAKDYLRHKSLLTTEQFYTQFFRQKKITRLQVVERPAQLQTPGATA